jgi:hypothetical protein
MKLQIGQTAFFNNHTYEVRLQIGSGAVSDVYLAVLKGAPAPAEVVIKLVHDQAGPDSRQAQGARLEADVLAVLNRAEDKQWAGLDGVIARFDHARRTVAARHVIAVLDSGIDADGRVFIIQEQAPPAFQRIPITGIEDERRILGVAKAVAQTIELAHTQGYALKDFEPHGEKGDRIRISWDAPSDIKIIDWNITAGPNATSEEKVNDLFYLGGHIYYFLTGEQIDISNWKPGGPDPLDTPGVSEGSRQITRRLLNRRYLSAREIRADLAWWIETLAMHRTADLNRRIQQAGDRADRKLAAADLAQRLEHDPHERERFERIADQLRRDLDRADRVLLDQGLLNLRTGLYRKAIEAFERNLRDPQFPPELAREAGLYCLQAQFAIWLREQTPGRNLANHPLWQLVGRAIDDLLKQRWSAALDTLNDAIDRLPAVDPSNPLHQLHGLARVGQLVDRTRELQSLMRGGPTALDALDTWIRDEQKRQVDLTQVVEQLRQATRELASVDPEIDTVYRKARQFLEKRKRQLDEYKQVSQLLRMANAQRGHADTVLGHASLNNLDDPAESDPIAAYAAIESVLTAILDAAGRAEEHATDTVGQPWLSPDIQARIDEVHAIQYNLRQLPIILGLLQRGKYDQALEEADQAAACLPTYAPANLIRSVAQTGTERQSKVQASIEQARASIRQRLFSDARNLLDSARSLEAQPLISRANRSILPANVGDLAFQLPNADAVQSLAGVIETIERARRETISAPARDHAEVLRELGNLRREIAPQGYGLSDDEIARLEEATRGQEQIQRAKGSLISYRGHNRADTRARADDLLATLAHLQGDPTDRAHELREEAAQEWLLLCKQEQNFKLVYKLLSDDRAAFSGTGAAAQIQDLRDLAEQGVQVARQLTPEGTEAPAWLDTDEQSRHLINLDNGLQSLRVASDHLQLQALRVAVQGWYDRMLSLVAAYLRERYNQICALSDHQKFVEARDQARAAWQSVPDQLRDAIPDLSSNVQQLLAELECRVQVDDKLNRIIQQLAIGAMSLSDALVEFPAELPSHPHIALVDIVGCINGLTELAGLLAASPPAHETEAQQIYRLYTRHEAVARIGQHVMLFIPAQALEGLLARIGRDAAMQAIQAADHLCARLRQLATYSSAAPREVAPLFWTAAWWQATSAERDPDASARAAEAVEIARCAHGSAAVQLRDTFANATSLPDIESALLALRQIRAQNTLPINLPRNVDLPANVTPPALAPLFDADALADWQDIAEEWLRIGRAVATQQSDASRLVQITEALETLQLFRRELEKLRRIIWPALFGEGRVDESNLERLDGEAQQLIDLAQLIRQAQALQRQMRMPEALQLLPQTASHEDSRQHTWLLKPVRETLLQVRRTLRGELQGAIEERTFVLLHLDDYEQGAQLLGDELLAKCATDDFARLIEHAILRGIPHPPNKTKKTVETSAPNRTSAQWRIVRDATMRWHKSGVAARSGDQSKADGHGSIASAASFTALAPIAGAGEPALPEQVRERWAFLHELATQELLKAEAAERIRQAKPSAGWARQFQSPLGVAALILLLIVILGGASAGLLIANYRQSSQNANQQLEALRATLAAQPIASANTPSLTTMSVAVSSPTVGLVPTAELATAPEMPSATAEIQVVAVLTKQTTPLQTEQTEIASSQPIPTNTRVPQPTPTPAATLSMTVQKTTSSGSENPKCINVHVVFAEGYSGDGWTLLAEGLGVTVPFNTGGDAALCLPQERQELRFSILPPSGIRVTGNRSVPAQGGDNYEVSTRVVR